VKRDGKWLKPLKFLGIEFDPKTDVVKGHNGSVCSAARLRELLHLGDLKNFSLIITGMHPAY
jgi:hypothetical protein